jgi:carbamoyltransferase
VATLGIHVGHDAACALVSEGRLIAAVQQERLTRTKHDGTEQLTNALPADACLRAAGATWSDVSRIVTSFQALAPGGIGLLRTPVANDFRLFEPYARNHFVLSHHLAHAYSAYGASGYRRAAALVCDLGGTSSIDGRDFCAPFSEWERALRSVSNSATVNTECVSMFSVGPQGARTLDKQYCVPHSAPETFVSTVGQLYENVSRFVLRQDHAHGQLMALAAYGIAARKRLSWRNMITSSRAGVVFRNDWQPRLTALATPLDNADLALACQAATEHTVLAYARQLRRLCDERNLVLAGGVFLNILANTAIWRSGLFDAVFVPSAPNDAGIAVGCAYYGDLALGQLRGRDRCPPDRLGLCYSEADIDQSLARSGLQAASLHPTKSVRRLARLIHSGKVIARFAGRAEFGPRALGGRSLLGSATSASTRDRLNLIKGRQPWRPVAPIVIQERAREFFDGPLNSYYMSFAHRIRRRFRDALPALRHPDNTTRAQVLRREEDPELYEVIVEYGRLSGFPILVNTSLNGPAEPIVETPEDAVAFFGARRGIDVLWIGTRITTRARLRRAPHPCMVSLGASIATEVLTPAGARAIIGNDSGSRIISRDMFALLRALPITPHRSAAIRRRRPRLYRELLALTRDGFLTAITFAE